MSTSWVPFDVAADAAGSQTTNVRKQYEIARCDNRESNSEVAKMTLAFVQRAVLGH